ncbi:hypothetical protein LPJ56_004771, partial [Coemansia sp. RSA 2599]
LVSPLHLRITTTALNQPVMRWTQGMVLRGSGWTAKATLERFYGIGVYAALISMVACLAVLLYASAQILGIGAGRLGYNGSVASAFISRLSTASSDPSIGEQGPGMLGSRHTYIHRHRHRLGLGYGHGHGHAHAHAHGDSLQLLRPVIPGLTLPLGHIWYYMAALAACAAVHELGHALAAAACARIGMRRMGMFVLGLYPGAFVDLPREQLERQSVRTQLRVVCAGVWHNAVTALVAWLLVYSGGLGLVFSATGWGKVADGVVVVDVSQASPLYGRLPLLSTVSRIDDVVLSPAAPATPATRVSANGTASSTFSGSALGSSPIARWTRALTDTASNRDTAAAGFCVRASENVDDGLCCEMSRQFPLGESPDPDIYCFDPYSSSQLMAAPKTDETMCFDLKSVLGSPDPQRCRSHLDCGSPSIGHGQGLVQTGSKMRKGNPLCVLPSSPFADSRVARIYYRPPFSDGDGNGNEDEDEDGEEQLIIYAGSLASLWLDVQVSSLRPRWRWLPYRLPSQAESLLQYVLSFSLAFCLLNAIPAWYLDGDHVLRLLLILRDGRTGGSAKSENSEQREKSSLGDSEGGSLQRSDSDSGSDGESNEEGEEREEGEEGEEASDGDGRESTSNPSGMSA